jgi:hypothetical protein
LNKYVMRRVLNRKLIMWNIELQMRIFSCKCDTENLFCWLIDLMTIIIKFQANKWAFRGGGDGWMIKNSWFWWLNPFTCFQPFTCFHRLGPTGPISRLPPKRADD